MYQEVTFAGFILVILAAFLAGFEWTVSNEKKSKYFLAAFACFAIKEFFTLAFSPEYWQVRIFQSNLETIGILLLLYAFLVSFYEELPIFKRFFQFNLLVLIILFFVTLAMGLSRTPRGEVFPHYRLWQAALLVLTLISIFTLPKPHPNKIPISIIFSLWTIMLILNLKDIKPHIILLFYLGLFLIAFKDLIVQFRFIENSNRALTQEKEVTLKFLSQIGDALHQAFDLDEVLKMIMNCIMANTRAQAGAIFLLTDDKQELTAKMVEGLFPPMQKISDRAVTKTRFIVEKVKADKVKVGEGIIGEVARTGNPILIKNAKNDARIRQSTVEYLEVNTMLVTPLKLKDEVLGVIALVNKKDEKRFTELDQSLLHALGYQAAISINNAKLYRALSEKERLEQELKIARDIQSLLLPEKSPGIAGFDIASLARPALEVGGDYFDFVRVSADELGIVIADVSGKGVPGALVMTMIRSTLRAEAEGKSHAAEVLCLVNEKVHGDLKGDMFVTISYAVLNFKTKKLSYARAGHEPLIILRSENKKAEVINTRGIAIGLDEGPVFRENLEELAIDLEEGDTVVFYTDGITETMNERHEEFGFERFLNLIVDDGVARASSLVTKIDKNIGEFTGKFPQHDDITLVVLRTSSPHPSLPIKGGGLR